MRINKDFIGFNGSNQESSTTLANKHLDLTWFNRETSAIKTANMGRQGYIYLQKIGDLKNQQEMGLVDRFSEIFHVDIQTDHMIFGCVQQWMI